MNSTRKIEDVIELYLAECEYIKRLRPATIRSYRELFAGFLRAIPEVTNVCELSPQLVNFFFRHVSEKNSGNAKVSTLRTYYDKLMAFFRWLEFSGYKSRGSLVGRIIEPPRPRYEDTKALSNDQVHKIISAISIQGIHNTFQFRRDIMIVQLLLYTGIRKGELLGIRVSDIDWVKRSLLIAGETSKSKRSRVIPLNNILFQSLLAYVSELKRLKIGTNQLIVSQRTFLPLTENGLKHWVKRYKEVSGVRFHLHQFRHTFACTLAKNNTDIMSIKTLLGHRNSSMTERYLRSITPESARDSIEKLSY